MWIEWQWVLEFAPIPAAKREPLANDWMDRFEEERQERAGERISEEKRVFWPWRVMEQLLWSQRKGVCVSSSETSWRMTESVVFEMWIEWDEVWPPLRRGEVRGNDWVVELQPIKWDSITEMEWIPMSHQVIMDLLVDCDILLLEGLNWLESGILCFVENFWSENGKVRKRNDGMTERDSGWHIVLTNIVVNFLADENRWRLCRVCPF
jgi:hypothetical protein